MLSTYEKDRVLDWFGRGEVGASSKAMALAAVGVPDAERDHPYDPDDFRRCLLLLDHVPEIRDEFDAIAAMSPTWSALVERWDELEKLFYEEAGSLYPLPGKTAPKLYEQIKEILKEAQK